MSNLVELLNDLNQGNRIEYSDYSQLMFCVEQLEKEKAELEETIDAQDDKIDFYVSKMNEHIRKNKNLEEDNLNKQDLINDYVFENAKLTKENEKLSKMLEIVLPKALEHENHIFYEHKRMLEQYRAELEKRVEEHKNDNNCPDVMCDDCNKECELKKIMGETK